MKKIISFWENQSKNGNVYYTGKIGEVSLIGFKNKQKKNPKEPDITFYVSEDKPKQKNTVYAKDIDVNDMFVNVEDNMLD